MPAAGPAPADTLHIVVRDAAADDAAAIDALTRAAFLGQPHSRQTEHRIVQALRDAGALSLSLVATLDAEVVGHLACSPVTVGGVDRGWCGLGPVSVRPARQRSGIGSALVRSSLRRLADRGVAGCVVLGDPAFYGRFGFAPQPGLTFPGVPPAFFMAVTLAGTTPTGELRYHAAFSVTA